MTAKILWHANSCQIVDEESEQLIKALDRHLSFIIQGAEHSKAFKGYINSRGEEVTWDGRRHLLRLPGLRFAPGLLHRVQQFYQAKQHPVEIVDCRKSETKIHPLDISVKLANLNKVPYNYQVVAVNTALNNHCGIIRMATGSGKSLVAALLTAKLGKTAIIYVIGQDLLYQIHDFFEQALDQPVGMIGDGKCEIHDINVATIWSVGQALGMSAKSVSTIDDESHNEKKTDPAKFRQIKDMLLRTKLHLLDECHLAACDTVQTIAQHIEPENIYGMSASPWRDDNADLLIESVLGPKIVDVSARKLITEGFLVPPIIRFLAPPPMKGKKHYKTIYSKYVVENEVRNQMVLTGTQKLVEQGYQTLVLFHSINHGNILEKLISQNVSCMLLSGKDNQKKRDLVKDQFENGKINCIIASKIFDIGIDIPSLSGLIVAGAGKSSVRALQRIGRVIRRYPGKTQAAVLDFADQAPYLLDHAQRRKSIYEQEFDVSWPKAKSENLKA